MGEPFRHLQSGDEGHEGRGAWPQEVACLPGREAAPEVSEPGA